MHWAWTVAQKPFDAAARQSFTREVAASHLVSPSRLHVARQSYILEVSHIHLCDWRRSLGPICVFLGTSIVSIVVNLHNLTESNAKQLFRLTIQSI